MPWSIPPSGAYTEPTPTDIHVVQEPPSQRMEWTVPPAFYAGTLGDPLGGGVPITSAPSPMGDAGVNVNRPIQLLPQFDVAYGAFGINFIALLYKKYIPQHILSMNEQFAMKLQSDTTHKNVLLTLPMANALLVMSALAAQKGQLESAYDEHYVLDAFSVDGVIQTTTGDEMLSTRLPQRRGGSAAITKTGRTLVKNIWGTGLQTEQVLYIGLRKFNPKQLLTHTYNIDPMGAGPMANSVLKELADYRQMGRPEQWVYQFVPATPDNIYDTSFDAAERKKARAMYLDEYDEVHRMRLFKIGVVEHPVDGPSVDITTVLSTTNGRDDHYGGAPIPEKLRNACFSTAAMASCTTVDIKACVF